MKFIAIIAMLLSPLFSKAQKGFPQGKYISDLGDIIIRNDSVITKDVSYYVFHYKSNVNYISELTTITYASENEKQVLTVVYKKGLPRHLIFTYKNHYEDSFNVAFIPSD